MGSGNEAQYETFSLSPGNSASNELLVVAEYQSVATAGELKITDCLDSWPVP
jgi:hypothetical protein